MEHFERERYYFETNSITSNFVFLI